MRFAVAALAVLLTAACLPVPDVPGLAGGGDESPSQSSQGDGHVTVTCAQCGGVDIVVSGGPAALPDDEDGFPAPATPPAVDEAGLPEPTSLDGSGDADAPLAMALRSAEDLSFEAYDDTGGVPHIGFGHRLTPDEAESLLAQDLSEARAAAERVVGDAWPSLHVDVQEALVEAAYVLGATGLARFGDMLAAVRLGDREVAAQHLLDSLWALQAPDRVAAIAARLAGGVVAPCPPREYP